MATTTNSRSRKRLASLVLLGSIGWSLAVIAGPAAESEPAQYYQMLSSVEYRGPTQFSDQMETLMTVRRQLLPGGRVKYFLSSDDVDLTSGGPESSGLSSRTGLSFIVDKKTGIVSEAGGYLGLLAKISNECTATLAVVSRANVGKTWKQSFPLASTRSLLPNGLVFTLTATHLETKTCGGLIGVRALSEPFVVKVGKAKEGEATIKARINAAYLFDLGMSDVYLSLSVFQAQTSQSGFPEVLRHEVATYKTNAAGLAVDLGGLGTKFGSFAKEVGLTSQGIKVKEVGPLPAWAQADGLQAAQVAHACAAMACEGAANPVASIYVPLARAIALQFSGTVAPGHAFGTVGHALADRVPGLSGVKIAAAPGTGGLDIGGPLAAGALGAGGIALGESQEKSNNDRSPREP